MPAPRSSWNTDPFRNFLRFISTWTQRNKPQEVPSRPQPQNDMLLLLRATHEWDSFETFLESFAAEQPQNLKLLQRAFGLTLQSSWISSHLLNPRKHANQPMGTFSHLFFELDDLGRRFGPDVTLMHTVPSEGQQVDLREDVVISIPWKPDSTREKLRTIGRDVHNSFQASDNHAVWSYRYFGVFWCRNGHHSIMTGILKQEGQVPVGTTWDPTVLLQQVQVSGEGTHYLKKATGEVLGPVASQEFAAIFRIAQERLKLGLIGP